MADESSVVRGFSWRETFPFTHLFRTFRIAIHPSKLFLGLAAILCLFIGGAFLDAIWPVQHRAVPNEISAYELSRMSSGGDFRTAREETRHDIEVHYANLLQQYGVVTDQTQAMDAAKDGKYLGDLKEKIIDARNTHVAQLKADYDKLSTATPAPLASPQSPAANPLANRNPLTTPNAPPANPLAAPANPLANPAASALPNPPTDMSQQDRLLRDAAAERDLSIQHTYDLAIRTYESAETVKNSGVFHEFFEYERGQFNITIMAVKRLSWVDGYHAIARFFTVGPVWLLTQHSIYFFIFILLFMTVWAVFGGAIARIAAVHVARDEKLSIRAALRFSTGKFLSFLFAPLIPLMIVGALGVLLMVGALVTNLPFFGPIIIGAAFFFAMAIGFLMAIVLVGTVGGFNLMYPTIAIEGSDSFDAISRSFSYLYARPWRLAFYTVIAVAYGAITYTFVKLFIALMFDLIHGFMSLGVFCHADNTRPLFNALWPGTGDFQQLTYDMHTLSLGYGQAIGAYLIAMWVYLAIGILGAYAVSFYFSANTIIYYLMRSEVDATDADDVYIEQLDDDDLPDSPAADTAAPDAVAPAAPIAVVPTAPVAETTPMATPLEVPMDTPSATPVTSASASSDESAPSPPPVADEPPPT